MRIFSATSLFMGLIFQVGCVSMLSPRATPMRLHAYNDDAAAQYVKAIDFENQGKLERAREIYQERLDKHPQNPDYLHRLAVVSTRLHRYGEASSLYERARQLDPKNVRLLADMGYSYFLNGDFSEAEQLLREAIHLKPNDARATSNLALVLGRQGKFDESLSLLRQVGNEAEALSDLAYIHRQRGETDLAEQRYREALAIDPKLKPAIRALAELSKNNSGLELVLDEPIPVSSEAVRVADGATIAPQQPVIQQVGAVADWIPRRMTTANVAEDSSSSGEPALLDENPEISEKAAYLERLPASINDAEPFDEEPSTALPDTANRDETGHDDDWAK